MEQVDEELEENLVGFMEKTTMGKNLGRFRLLPLWTKVGCIVLVVVVSILPHAEFGRNDHRRWSIGKTHPTFECTSVFLPLVTIKVFFEKLKKVKFYTVDDDAGDDKKKKKK